MKLPESYYLHHHVVEIAEDLIGKVLTTNINGHTTSGIITETEAYNGIYDKACHAYNGKRTLRNEAMYGSGGISYVYLCYGIHHLFNIVTNQQDIPDAVLIRGIFPLNGLDKILERRKSQILKKDLTTGPGKVSEALGINKNHNRIILTDNTIHIENRNIRIPSNLIQTGKRIGIDYAGEDALLPYRFYVKWENVLEKVLP
jgi:DNA-3-methyladenine glycosylase